LWENIGGDLGGKVNILERDSIGHCERIVYINTCLNLIGYGDKAILRPKT